MNPFSLLRLIPGTAFACVCALLAFRALKIVIRSQRETQEGITPLTYILFSIIAWGAETNILRLARLTEQNPGMDWKNWNVWAPFTLWWPPSVLAHWPSLSWAKRPEWLLTVTLTALLVAFLASFLRLENADLPIWLGFFAAIPFANFGLFLFLSVVPTRASTPEPRNWKEILLPRDALGSGVVSCVITSTIGIILSQFGTTYVGIYGWVLFALVPVAMGFFSALIYGATERRSAASCISVALASVVLGGLVILGFAIEGVICVFMAAPLALPLAALGGWLGYLAQRRVEVSAQRPQIAGALLLFLPFMMVGEQKAHHGAPQIAVSTSIVIHAPADRVWKSVIRLSSVPKPDSAIFYSVAYPIKTTLEGSGVGAQRQCVFSTGSIVEPIEVWQPGRELRFSVISQPPLMRELSPYPDVHPPHLKLHYLRSEEGQFTFTPRADGSTLLTGTSYYESRLWPGAYWQIWTDGIAHRVHQVVLEEVKRQSEL